MARLAARIQVCNHNGECTFVKGHQVTVEGAVVEIHLDHVPEFVEAVETAADELLADE